MKKKYSLLVLFSLFILTSCQKKIEKVSFDDVENMIANKESFIYYAGSESCYNCQVLKKNIKKNRKITYYYVDIDEISKDEQEYIRQDVTSKLPSSFYESNGLFNYQTNLYTPAILKYVKGELVYTYNLSMSKEEVKELYSFNLVDLGYYQNFEYKIDNNDHFSIIFYNDIDKSTNTYISNIRNELEENNEILYCLKYSKLTNFEKDELVSLYQSNYDSNIISFNNLPNYLKISY